MGIAVDLLLPPDQAAEEPFTSVTLSSPPKTSFSRLPEPLTTETGEDLSFEIGGQSFSVTSSFPITESDYAAAGIIRLDTPIESNIAGEFSPVNTDVSQGVYNISIDTSLEGEFPYNAALRVRPAFPGQLELPQEGLMVDSNGRVCCTADISVNLPRGVIDDGEHQTLFDSAPVIFHSGTYLGLAA